MKYRGLITDEQPEVVQMPLPQWQYGEIRDGRKIIDPILHFGCFVLGYKNDEIVDFVADVVKHNRPELGERVMPKTNTARLNHISFEFAERVYRTL
jgi:acetylornithine/succinyldiaminopimelate/putrescine aminotransferase